MFRIFSKKNGKAPDKPKMPVEDQTIADDAIRLALEACDANLKLTRNAKGAAKKVRTVIDDLVSPMPFPVKK